MKFQVKVEYSAGKFIKFFKDIDTKEYKFNDLVRDIIKNCPSLAHLTAQTMRIRYADEDGDFVNLNEDDIHNFDEMLSHSKFFEERNYKKILLRVNELDSPICHPAEKKRKRTRSDLVSELEPRSLNFAIKPEQSSVSILVSDDREVPMNTETFSDTQKSPLERYLEKAEKDLEMQTVKLQIQLNEREEINNKLHAANLAAGDPNTSVCGNCHLRLGHTQKTCGLERCTDVFFCGQEKRHVGQVNKKRLDQEIARQKKLVADYGEEINKRKAAIQTVEKSKTKQIESVLLEENKCDYICHNANETINWNLVRRHATVIESYCKKHLNGRIPSKNEIPAVPRTALAEYNTACGQSLAIKNRSKGKGNPTMATLEEHGINFPTAPYAKERPACGSERATDNSDIYRALPKNEEEERNQIEIAMNASLHFTQQQNDLCQTFDHETAVVSEDKENPNQTTEHPGLTDESAALALLSLNIREHQK